MSSPTNPLRRNEYVAGGTLADWVHTRRCLVGAIRAEGWLISLTGGYVTEENAMSVFGGLFWVIGIVNLVLLISSATLAERH